MFPLGVHGSLCCNPQAYSSAIPFSANSFKQQAHRVLVGHSLLMEGLDLLLFCGIALHVKIIAFSPRLATFHASGVPCLTMFCASVAPRLMTLLLTGLLFLTLLHTGRRWSCRCWSGWCWSGWLHLSLSI